MITFDTSGHTTVAWLEKKEVSDSYYEIHSASSGDWGDTFSEAVSKSPNKRVSSFLTEMGKDNLIYFFYVWLTDIQSISPSSELLFSDETDKPATLISSLAEAASGLPFPAGNPDIAVSTEGSIHLAWREGSERTGDIYYRRSITGGTDFSASKAVSEIIDADLEGPLLAVEGSLIANLTWVDSDGDNEIKKIRFDRTTDGGSTFLPPKTLSQDGIDSFCPKIAKGQDGQVYIAWVGTDTKTMMTDIYLISTHDGINFSDVTQVDSDSASCPQIAVGPNDDVYLTWEEASEIYFVLSSDGGHSFSPKINISKTENARSSDPRIIADAPFYINIVWTEKVDSNNDIYFAGSSNGGLTFSVPENISNTTGDSLSPVIGSGGAGHLYIAWVDYTPGNKEIFFRTIPGAKNILPDLLISPRLIRPIDNSYISSLSPSIEWTSEHGALKYEIQISPTRGFETPVINEIITGDTKYNPDISQGNYYVRLRSGQGDVWSEWSAPVNFRTGSVTNDLNSDGFSDLAIGAPGALYNKGVVYIYFGESEGPQESASVIISGTEVDGKLGTSTATGDINGDGFADLLMGAPEAINKTGIVYIFFGGYEWGTEIRADDADVIISGEMLYDYFGQSAAMGGDVNDDGYGDILIGAHFAEGAMENSGQTYLFYGGTDLTRNYTASEGSVFSGEETGDSFGSSVSYVGDINDDGYTDFMIGAPEAENNSGKVYFYYGDAGTVVSKDDLTLRGNEGEFFGRAISGGGDINQDGWADFLIGADSGGTQAGRVTLYFGGAQWEKGTPVVIEGLDKDKLGFSVNGMGDVDNKGHDDLIIGAPWGFQRKGAVYIFTGELIKTKPGYPYLSIQSADLALIGETQGNEFGVDVSGAGYANGDTVPDWMAGAYLGGINYSGLVYFYHGGNLSDLTPEILSGGSKDEQFGRSLNKDMLP